MPSSGSYEHACVIYGEVRVVCVGEWSMILSIEAHWETNERIPAEY